MTTITLLTTINAPIERCFDLSWSIDLHLSSTVHTSEKAIAGKTSGLINKGETVTWEAIHFGIKQQLTSIITEMIPPLFFSDKMVKGAFKSMYHEHHFEYTEGATLMKDIFTYDTPLGLMGKLFDLLVLERYMRQLLLTRNAFIKKIAEGHTTDV
ncbi:MAG: SRPBCC family protein [Flavipsychrobacter sp.]|nr:SRPBCC family protein [Flavipsychrobacter sp.]